MKATITSKGQITIPIEIRRKLKLGPGQILDFDENTSFLKATKVFDKKKMRSVLGCCKTVMPRMTGEKWFNETRGSVELPSKPHANRD